jgi:hypothetical protein
MLSKSQREKIISILALKEHPESISDSELKKQLEEHLRTSDRANATPDNPLALDTNERNKMLDELGPGYAFEPDYRLIWALRIKREQDKERQNLQVEAKPPDDDNQHNPIKTIPEPNVKPKKFIKLSFSVIGRIVVSIMLLLSLISFPYDYYQILRLFTTTIAAYCAVLAHRQNKESWTWAFSTIALLFNPFLPVKLGRDLWKFADIIVALILIVSIKYFSELTSKEDRQPS